MTSDREDILLRRQKILADFGDFALQSEDMDEILTQACRLVGEAMETGRAKVLEIEGDGKKLLVRAGEMAAGYCRQNPDRHGQTFLRELFHQ